MCSLDAPTVVLVWVLYACHVGHVTATPALCVAIFTAAWAVYATDRLLDARRAAGWQERHEFHAWHARAFTRLVPVAVIVAGLALLHAPPAAVQVLLLITAVFAAWFAAVHLLGGRAELPKELTVGIVFAAVAVAPAWSLASGPARAALAALVVEFALLGVLNTVLITAWEHDLSRSHATTRLLARHRKPLMAAGVLLPLAFLLFPQALGRATLLAPAASVAAMLWLDRRAADWQPVTRRAAADAVLLVPALPLLAEALYRHLR